MKVKDLVQLLLEENPDAPVYLDCFDCMEETSYIGEPEVARRGRAVVLQEYHEPVAAPAWHPVQPPECREPTPEALKAIARWHALLKRTRACGT